MFLRCTLVFPINVAGIRNQIFESVFGKSFPGYLHVCLYNLFNLGIALIFAIFYDRIGDIFRYGLSFCGMVLVYIFPFVMELKSTLDETGSIPIWSWVLHVILIALGILIFISQFFVT